DGEQASFLETGREYTISFNICFRKDYNKIRFDFSAQDITGKSLQLFSLSEDTNFIHNVKESDNYNIKNTFKCDVYKGQYVATVQLYDVSDDRYDDLLKGPEIKIRFEVGILTKESIIEIQKI
ncbi:ABC transporter ATP-binding protein, partial [Francisella philomiragia]